MTRLLCAFALALLAGSLAAAGPGSAEPDPEAHAGGHEGHGEAPPVAPEAPEPPAGDPSAHHHHAPAIDESPDEAVGDEPAPAPPRDHAADAVFDPAAMERARDQLRREHGRALISKLMLNLGEYRVQGDGPDGYRWDAEGRLGGYLHRLVVKTEGEGSVDSGLESAELQGLYSRAFSPFFDAQVGVRQDFEPTTKRTYAALGVEGLAPFWFNVQAALFVSDHGDVLARAEGSYDIRLLQRLVLQPQAEINVAAQDVPEAEIGAGLSTLELGLRLRYEIRRELAPYVGVSWDRAFGDTADLARKSGEGESSYGFVVGLRAWF